MSSITKNLLAAVALSGTAISASAVPLVLKPTVVLVHGAFADGSAWQQVIPLLEAHGVKVVAVQNPLTALEDDVAATRRAIEAVDGPVVLVGHSWGGAVITEAGVSDSVKALVYVAAFAPSEGESVADLTQHYPVPSGFSHIVADKYGFLKLTQEGVEKHLAQDVPADKTKLMTATQGPVRGKNFEQKVAAAAWKGKPSWYIVSEQDYMLQTSLQRAMAKKIGAHTVSLKAGHTPQISQPEAVAQVILEAVSAQQ
ncbi:alpha/beta fold hydrolase [Pseudoduganella danionis]|uniref:Alpha/beta fold hydrolase n=1 Tax=Pseudoduganella danionis TaxID=1890295 RepID=A0ABW9SK16_9BURK|nr:alpha/beta hydrolase [Pseudoduganella danionis]MTW32508.1 alpha/beta fold hydrolase [Pseudoduganella danionis]